MLSACLITDFDNCLFLEQASWFTSYPNSTIKPNQSCPPYITENEILADAALLFGKGLAKVLFSVMFCLLLLLN